MTTTYSSSTDRGKLGLWMSTALVVGNMIGSCSGTGCSDLLRGCVEWLDLAARSGTDGSSPG